MSTFTVRAETGVCKAPPFAQLPHHIAADPRLTPVDVRVVAALLFWARDKASCDTWLVYVEMSKPRAV